MKNTLAKSERLSSERSIDALFGSGRRGSAGPLRFCWVASPSAKAGGDRETSTAQPMEAVVSVLFSVPKKHFKRAWKRNLIKRRMRESYRQRKHALTAAAEAAGRHIDIALICTPSGTTTEIPDYKTIDNAIAKILEKILERS